MTAAGWRVTDGIDRSIRFTKSLLDRLAWLVQGCRVVSTACGSEGGCIKAFSETDLTEDLQRIDVPTLIVHGDDDQIVPIDASARRSVELVMDATLKVYPGASHGLAQVAPHKDQFNADLLDFIRT